MGQQKKPLTPRGEKGNRQGISKKEKPVEQKDGVPRVLGAKAWGMEEAVSREKKHIKEVTRVRAEGPKGGRP